MGTNTFDTNRETPDHRSFAQQQSLLSEARKNVGVDRLYSCNDPTLCMSDAGVASLISRELEIPGFYVDIAGVGTYGIGHKIHEIRNDNAPSFLLVAAAQLEKTRGELVRVGLFRSGDGSRSARMKFLGRNVLLQLGASDRQKMANAATEVAKADFGSRAESMVREELRLLSLQPMTVFRKDLPIYEAVVRRALGEEAISQYEFDLLVQLAFNTPRRAVFRVAQHWSVASHGAHHERKRAQEIIKSKLLEYNKIRRGGKHVTSSELSDRRMQEASGLLLRLSEESRALDSMHRVERAGADL